MSIPLVIDLDGTLLRSDLLVESGISFLRKSPLKVFSVFGWLAQGKVSLKTALAENSDVDVSVLPYNQNVLSFIRKEKAVDRQIILATASHISYAKEVADFLLLFDRVIATEDINLSGKNKRDRLVQEFGEKGFDYAGNSSDDLIVWASARNAYVVDPNLGVESRARTQGNVTEVIKSSRSRAKSWVKALRFHQWLKNALIFVPLMASHNISRGDLLLDGVVAFILFGFCASSVYILNDLLDLTDDRHHGRKKYRPFAAGHLPLTSGLIAFPSLLAFSFIAGSLLLPPRFILALGTYYVLTLAYSIYLKRLMMVDVIVLASLYTMRIIAGIFTFRERFTFWILAFSMFIFLSLALVKRYAELFEANAKGKTEKTRGRGYYPGDLGMLSSLGAASGYLSVLVLALYIQDQTTVALYAHPQFIWLACPLLLFWISRIWLLTYRGRMHDDPVVFAARDRVSWGIGALLGVIFWLAI